MSAAELMDLLKEACQPAEGEYPVTLSGHEDLLIMHQTTPSRRSHVPVKMVPELMESPEIMRKVLRAGRAALNDQGQPRAEKT